MFEAKFKYRVNRFLPFIVFGIGPAWNKADGFSVQGGSSEGTEKVIIPSSANRSTNLAYQLGVGLDCQLSEGNYKDYIGVSYRYVNLGKINFCNLINNSVGGKFGEVPIVTHNVMIHYTHYFGRD